MVEGEANAASVVDLARRVNVTMPICETVHSILTGEVGMSRAFADLWTRPIESEPRALAIEMNNPAMTSGTRLDGGAA